MITAVMFFWCAGMRASLIPSGCTKHLRRAFRHTVASSVDCMPSIRVADDLFLPQCKFVAYSVVADVLGSG